MVGRVGGVINEHKFNVHPTSFVIASRAVKSWAGQKKGERLAVLLIALQFS